VCEQVMQVFPLPFNLGEIDIGASECQAFFNDPKKPSGTGHEWWLHARKIGSTFVYKDWLCALVIMPVTVCMTLSNKS